MYRFDKNTILRCVVKYREYPSKREQYARLYIDGQKKEEIPNFSIKVLSEVSGISEKKLRTSIRNIRNGLEDKGPGRRKKISPEIITQLLNFIYIQSNLYHPPSINELIIEIRSIMVKECPFMDEKEYTVSRTFIRNFLKENRVDLVSPIFYNINSLYISSYDVKNYIEDLNILFSANHYESDLIFNFDESWINTDRTVSHFKVCCSQNCRINLRQRAKIPKHITILPCISATGFLVSVFYLWPYKRYNSQTLKNTYHNYPVVHFQKNGWMDKFNFHCYISTVLVPTINIIRQSHPNERALIIADGHSSRTSPQTIEVLKKNRIDLVILPSHSTKYLQPLDSVIFNKYKSQLIVKAASIQKYEVLKQSELAISSSCTPNTVKESFKMCGIFPFNPELIRNKIPPLMIQDRERSRFSISGKCITKDEVFEEIKRIYSA